MDMKSGNMEIQQIANLLNNLSRIKAPDDFETTLFAKINSTHYKPKYQEERWWEKFLLPQRLIPSAAAGLAIIILFFVFTISGSESENPLMAQPKLRSEVNIPPVKENLTPENKSVPKVEVKIPLVKKTDIETAKNDITEPNMPGQLYTSSDNNTSVTTNGFTTASFSGSVNKSGYNFLQVRLNNQEKEKIDQLRNKIRGYLQGKNR